METHIFRYVEASKLAGREIIESSALPEATIWWENPGFRDFVKKNHLENTLLVVAKGDGVDVLIGRRY